MHMINEYKATGGSRPGHRVTHAEIRNTSRRLLESFIFAAKECARRSEQHQQHIPALQMSRPVEKTTLTAYPTPHKRGLNRSQRC